jgi:hypothetical protein
MTSRTRIWLLGTVACAVVGLSAPAAQGAFGLESFFAANCKVSTCNKAATPAEEKEKAEAEGYSQASGHPPFGVTDFKLNRHQIQTVPFPAFAPEGNLKNLRIDVAPGVSTNPEAVAKCSVENFTSTEVEPVKHIFSPPNCPESTVIGENKVTTVLEVAPGVFADVPLSGKVYNLEQPTGFSSYFGVALQVGEGLFVHTFIEGHVEWGAEPQGTGKADYHDIFEIKNIPPGLLESRLIFNGNIGTGGFITNPSNCVGPGPNTTTGWHGESYEGEAASSVYTTPIGTEGCNGLPPFALVPFAPAFSLTPETKQSDQPDGITTELTLPHDPNPANLDSSQLKTASVTLPEGMTLNPSAAQGLEACTPAQARIHSPVAGVACPEKSEIRHARRPRASAGIADRQALPRRTGIGTDHGSSVHDVHRRRVPAIWHLCAPSGRGAAQRNDGSRHRDVLRKPGTALQQPGPALQGRRACADRQPTRVWAGHD